ncbi:MAG: hypothetical protein SVZ03_09665 [Spirochaetota bacterium]|nr:hypothetical protein [Spirochaetota bacterium]
MAKGLHRWIKYLYIIITLLISIHPLFAITEKGYLYRIEALARSGSVDDLTALSKKFFKQFPKSKYIPDVRFILAQNERETDKAIRQYRIIVDKYRFYLKRDYAQHKLCQILYLLSRWSDLRDESLKGIGLFKKSRYLTEFQLLLVKAYLQLEMYEEAEKASLAIMQQDHSYENLAESLLLLSYTQKKIYGFSRRYIQKLSEIITGFSASPKAPTAIYLLGRYYEAKEDYNRAYSAYMDVLNKYSKSPESFFTKRRLDSIHRHNPSMTDYAPDNDSIKAIDNLDIEPDLKYSDQNDEDGVLYAICLGRFNNLKDAREIKALINRDFAPISIIKAKNSFFIYASRLRDRESAIFTKIRLAEEFGLNGKIVRILRDEKRQYIYE